MGVGAEAERLGGRQGQTGRESEGDSEGETETGTEGQGWRHRARERLRASVSRCPSGLSRGARPRPRRPD